MFKGIFTFFRPPPWSLRAEQLVERTGQGRQIRYEFPIVVQETQEGPQFLDISGRGSVDDSSQLVVSNPSLLMTCPRYSTEGVRN